MILNKYYLILCIYFILFCFVKNALVVKIRQLSSSFIALKKKWYEKNSYNHPKEPLF